VAPRSYIAYKSSSANVYFTISRVTGDEGTLSIAMQRRDDDDVEAAEDKRKIRRKRKTYEQEDRYRREGATISRSRDSRLLRGTVEEK